MSSRVLKITALVVGLIVFFVVAFLSRKAADVTPFAVATPTPGKQSVEAAAPVAQSSAPKGLIEDFQDRLQRRQVTWEQLLAFRKSLLEGDPATIISQIRAFLATGKDVATGMAFELGQGGLERAPTLRLLLLDVLGQLSRKAGTADAAEVSKEILAVKKSPDEWAVALRNVAWHDPQSRPFLASKFNEMVRHEPWRSDPSAGFLEAFDVAVFSRQVTVMEPLNDMLATSAPDLQRAAAVALDRLAETAPLEVMQKLNAQPQLFADHPFLRADWFAKADLREPAQRAMFEFYLARTDVSFDEKTKALKALASPGQFISENLITPPPTPDDDSARGAAVLSAATEWSRRFPELNAPLATLRERLSP